MATATKTRKPATTKATSKATKAAPKAKKTRDEKAGPSVKDFRSLLTSGELHDRSRGIEKDLIRIDPSKQLSIPAVLAKYAAQQKTSPYAWAAENRRAALAIRAYLKGDKGDPRAVDRILEASDRLISRLIEGLAIIDRTGTTEQAEATVLQFEKTIAEVVAEENGDDDEPLVGIAAEKIQAAAKAAKVKTEAKAKAVAPKAKAKAKKAETPTVAKVAKPVKLKAHKPVERTRDGKAGKPKATRNIVRSNPDKSAPPTEIARGDVKTIDERNVKAIRAALGDAIESVAKRFKLEARVGKARADAYGVSLNVVLDVKDAPPLKVIDYSPVITRPDNRLTVKPIANQIGSLTRDEKAVVKLFLDAHDDHAKRIAKKVVVGADGLKKIVKEVPNLVDRSTLSVTRISDAPLDFTLSFTCKGAYSYTTSEWMLLGAVRRLVDWKRPEVARMTSYPQLAAVGDFRGVSETGDEKLRAIFEKFIAPKVAKAVAKEAPAPAAPEAKAKAKKTK